jgi:hypothetical protein
MKKSPFLLPLLALSALMTLACNEKVSEPDPFTPAFADTASNVFAFKAAARPDTVFSLRADTGAAAVRPFAYFDLDGKAALSATADTSSWDIAFRATGIRVKGEYRVLGGALFDSLKVISDSGFALAAGTLATPWYNYISATNTILPKDSTVILLKTSSGKYAKVEILSYYKNRPLVPVSSDTARYYTFRYFVQPDGSRNLKPEAAPYTYYSLRTGTEVSDTNAGWDLAFRSTTVKVNGESRLLSLTDFDTLAAAPTSGYGPGSTPLTWYDYSGAPNHTISPKLATVLVLKTRDNKYAKVQFLSYYKNAPANPNGVTHDTLSRNYTFRYFLQTDGTTKLK